MKVIISMVRRLYIDDRNIDRNISSTVWSINSDANKENMHYFEGTESRCLFSNQLRDLTNQGLYGTIDIDSDDEMSFNAEYIQLELKYSKGFNTKNHELKSSNILGKFNGDINCIKSPVLGFYFDVIKLLEKYNASFNIFPVDVLTSVGNYRFDNLFSFYMYNGKCNIGMLNYELYKYLYNFADLHTRELFVDFGISNYNFLLELKKDVRRHQAIVSRNVVNNNVELLDFFKGLFKALDYYLNHMSPASMNKSKPTGQFNEFAFFSDGVLEFPLLKQFEFDHVFVDEGILKQFPDVFDIGWISEEHSDNVPLIRACDMLLGYYGQMLTRIVIDRKFYWDRNFTGDVYSYEDSDLFTRFYKESERPYRHFMEYHYKLSTIQDFYVQRIRNILLDSHYINIYYPFWDDAAELWTYYAFSAFAGYDVKHRDDAVFNYNWSVAQAAKFKTLEERKLYMHELSFELMNNLYMLLYHGKVTPLWKSALQPEV